MEFVVTVFGIQLVSLSQFLDNIIQKLEVQAAFFGTFVTFLINGGEFDAIGYSSIAIKVVCLSRGISIENGIPPRRTH